MITKKQIMESAHQLRELRRLGPEDPGILGAYLNTTCEDEDFSSIIPDTSLRSILILLIGAHYWYSTQKAN